MKAAISLALLSVVVLDIIDAKGIRALHPHTFNTTGTPNYLEAATSLLSESNTTLDRFVGNVATQVTEVSSTVGQYLEDVLRNRQDGGGPQLIYHSHPHIHEDGDDLGEDHDRVFAYESGETEGEVTEDQVVGPPPTTPAPTGTLKQIVFLLCLLVVLLWVRGRRRWLWTM